MVLVDTSVWIDFFGGVANPESRWMYDHLDSVLFGLPDLVLCELLQGARDDRDAAKLRGQLHRFTIVRTGGENLAISSATNYRALRREGITVRKTIDCIIATFCMEHGYLLLHRDRDFDSFERHLGLKVVHPEAESGTQVT